MENPILKLRRQFRLEEKKPTKTEDKNANYFNDEYVFWLEDKIINSLKQ